MLFTNKSTYLQGIDNKNSACVMIALDHMFPNGYHGRKKLVKKYNTTKLSEKGFDYYDLYEVQYYAPVYTIRDGSYNVRFNQGERFVRIFDYGRHQMLKIPANNKMVFCYSIENNKGHAVCIYAADFLTFLNKYTYNNAMIEAKGIEILK